MPATDGAALRAWRRSRSWDVPEMARQLRRAARATGQAVAAHSGLIRMIYAWERGDHNLTERYELLYAAALGVIPEHLRHGPRVSIQARDRAPDPFEGDEESESPVQPAGADELASALSDLGAADSQDPAADPDELAASAARARAWYQACRYAQLTAALPALIRSLNASCAALTAESRDRAHVLSADIHHVAAGTLLKRSDHSLATLAADRSMRAALASGDPVAIAASARIITHVLMAGGHPATAVATATSYASRLDRDMPVRTQDSLSVYGALLLRGAIAAAQNDSRHAALGMLAEAEDAAGQLAADANRCWTAFNSVNATLHRINVAVSLGDAGTALDLARTVDPGSIAVTERKAALYVDTARAWLQRARHGNALDSLRAAHDIAPEEVTSRPAVRALVRELARSAPVTVRREAAQFAAGIGITQ